MDSTTKTVKEMTLAEFRQACADACRPPQRRGVDMDALNKITQGRKAGELNPAEYKLARAIIARGDSR